MRKMPTDMMTSFYQRCKAMSCEGIRALLSRQVTAKWTDKTKYAMQGKYLPLSVWEKEGWPVKAIEENSGPEDKEWVDKYKIWTYRVAIRMDEEGTENDVEDQINFKNKRKTRALKRRRTDDSEPTDEASDCVEHSEEESEDSSQAAGKPKAKSKAKAKGKARRPKKTPLYQEVLKAQKEAKPLLKKLDKALLALRDTTKHHLVLEVDPTIIEPVRTNMMALGDLTKRLKAIIENEVLDRPAIDEAAKFDAADLKPHVKELKKALRNLERK